MINFRQVPVFKENAQFTITEHEFRRLMELGDLIEGLFNKNIENGNLSIKYVDDEGNEISEQQVRDFLNQYNGLVEE